MLPQNQTLQARLRYLPMAARRAERGVVLIITMVALVLLLLGAVAMVRSVDTSSVLSGNLAFKRDLANQSDRALVAAYNVLNSGALRLESTRQADQGANNYSSVRLASNANGIPSMLIKDSLFGAAMTGSDIYIKADGSLGTSAADAVITMRYVIDRQCAQTGAFSVTACVTKTGYESEGGTVGALRPSGTISPVYRISVRVTGPRNTQAFFQSTVSQMGQ